MRKLKLYLETTVWNFVFADDAPEKRDATLKFFEEIGLGKYEIFISDLVFGEIDDADPEARERLTDLINKYNPVELKNNHEIRSLSEKYMAEKIIPEKFKRDATHIAFAVVNDLNAIVSWNLKHIVKLKTRVKTNAINLAEGYRDIEICTPEEVIEND
ncbi:MAG: hypothetical protein A7316_07140 [Candidatus Altiarchaeales archaeon WOR_SM1_86-2]|nr:MAG: hypothetical protein A7316_07140 [Candidatus Altiarchaeales archaeon WOR_SM1_86-2]